MMLSISVAPSIKRSFVRPSSRSLTPCRAVASSVSTLKESKDKLRNQIKDLSAELYAVPENAQKDLEGVIEVLERANPTTEPRNVPDKFAGSWLMLYTSRTLPETQRSMVDPARLSKVYYSIDLEGSELTKNLEFAVDGDRLPGCMNMSYTFEWESASKLKLESKGVSMTSDELSDKLQGKTESLVDAYGIRGSFELTFEDDGLLLGRDDENQVYVLEHRITRVHA